MKTAGPTPRVSESVGLAEGGGATKGLHFYQLSGAAAAGAERTS